ncbi:hypothetical protein LDENG_00060240 [Lucifuga dentata]|nr:hypothetical protein LDENG_00060240 [Lucifuga dentata]
MALMKHRGLFELLESEGRKLLLSKLQSCEISSSSSSSKHEDCATASTRITIETMLEELAPNLWEDDLDRLVDFGHLISPELEMVKSTENTSASIM